MSHPIALKRKIYIGISLLVSAIAVIGFWETYFGLLIRGSSESPPLIHFHAAVFVGWLIIFLMQSVFAATGKIHLHLKLGRFGLGYGVFLIIVGLYTTVIRSAERVAAGNEAGAAGLMWVGVADMIFFAVFFGAAAYYRKKPNIHKRAMIVAATALLVAAVVRMPNMANMVPILLLIWSSPILLAMGYDFAKERKVHIVFILGLIALVARFYSIGIVLQTDFWSSVTTWATGLVL